MGLLKRIYNKLIINESISVDSVTDAIKNKYQVVINYEGDPSHGIAPGKRVVEVYAYGLTKAGNPCFRGYQPYGDTVTETPEWKLFRVDRVISWNTTHKKILRPAPKFNPNGDGSMSQVFTIADFSQDTNNPDDATPQKYTPVGNVDNIDQILKDREMDKTNRRDGNRTISRFRNPNNRDVAKPEIEEPTKDTTLDVNLDNTTIPEPKIDGVDDIEHDNVDDVNIDDNFKTPGDEQLEKMKDLSRRMDNAPKIDLSKFK